MKTPHGSARSLRAGLCVILLGLAWHAGAWQTPAPQPESAPPAGTSPASAPAAATPPAATPPAGLPPGSSATTTVNSVSPAGATAAGVAPIAPVAAPAAPGIDDLTEILVQADEPRFVAPTRRDRIGRIWAPVFINGKGPYRLVLDTGASHSAVMLSVAQSLGMVPDAKSSVRLRGVTGSAVVPVIKVNSLQIGDLLIEPIILPIVSDALGGAEGILGTEGLFDKRIFIDFRKDRIRINTSRSERAGFGFITVPVRFLRGKLLSVDASVGDVRVKAIIDTGGQATIANLALRDALLRHRSRLKTTKDEVMGATMDIQSGDTSDTPPIEFGGMQIRGARVTFGDMRIFEHWNLTSEPAMLIGMDALGLLDTLIIDYKRKELQMRTRIGS
jgi:hypothetical protein